MTFIYKAKSKDAELHVGELEAVSKKAAMVELMSRNLKPISLEEKDVGVSRYVSDAIDFTAKDLQVFTEELSELLNAGLPLEPALSSMENRDEKGALSMVSRKIREDVTDGVQLHKSMELASGRFDSLYVNLVAAGEASGALGAILREHAKYLKEQAKLRSKILVAMIYPACLLVLCLSVILVFIFYLLPQITTMLANNKGQEIPVGLRMATGFGDFVKYSWPWLVLCIFVMILGVKYFFVFDKNKRWWDEVKVSLPFYGKIYQYGFYVQWLKTLGSLLLNGVTQLQALRLANETVSNRYYKEVLRGAVERVEDGMKLTQSMKQAEVFPMNMVDLIAVGDQTGDMTSSVRRAGEYFETKLNTIMNGLMALVTPVVLLGMALVIGALSYTMMQAIYGAIESMKR